VRSYIRDRIPKPVKPTGPTRPAGTTPLNLRFSPITNTSVALALDRAFANGIDGLIEAIPNGRTRQIILLRYGGWTGKDGLPLYKNPDGSPIWIDPPLSIPKIAERLGVSDRTVKNHIDRFLNRQTQHQPLPTGSLLDVPDLQRNRAAIEEVLPKGINPTDLVFDQPDAFDPGLTRSTKTFAFRTPEGPHARAYPPKERTTRDADGKVVQVDFFRRPDDKGTNVVPAGTLFTHGDQVLARQASLFQSQEFTKAVAAAERAAGIEPAPGVDPPAPSPIENVAAAAAAEGAALPRRKSTAKARQRDFTQLGGVAATGFPSKQRKTPFLKATKSHVDLYFEARNQITGEGLDNPHFQALREDQRLRHVIVRLSTAPSDKRWVDTIRKYAGVAAKHKGKFFGSRYPTFHAMAKLVKLGRRGLNRAELDQLVRDRAAETSSVISAVPRPVTGRASQRITESDTGLVHDVADMGTAALILDARALRQEKAANLEPPGFDFLKIDFPPGDGGPRLPGGPDRAGDGEHNGVPPGEGINRAEHQFIWRSRIKPMIDVMADVANFLGAPDLVRAGNALRTGYQIARNNAATMTSRAEKIAKKNRIKRARLLAIGEAAADLDLEAHNIAKARGDGAAESWVRLNHDRVLREAGLGENEIAFARDMRPLWNEMFVDFGIGFDRYVHGYFARYKPGDVVDAGTLIQGGDLSAQRSFQAFHERTGELKGQELNYFDVFNSYARTGYRFKELGTSPGSNQPSTWEFTLSVMERYGVRNGGEVGGPTWMEPLRAAFLRSQGGIDKGIQRAQQAARGRVQKLINLEQKALDAVDNFNLPMKDQVRGVIERHMEDLNIKLDRKDLTSYIDLFITLNRARTFGLHSMRAIRHLTQSWFFTLPRVGAKAFSQAVGEMLNSETRDKVYAEAHAAGVIKQAFFEEFTHSRSRFIRGIEHLSFMYSKLDIWERTLSYRAQQIRSQKAEAKFKERTHMSFDEKWELYKGESGLDLLHPGFEVLVRDHYQRGNFAEGNVAHSRLLVDHVLFDYTRINAPLWATASVWGRFFGQYGRWPLSAVETMAGMLRFGSYQSRARVLATYGAVSAAVYAMGQGFGVRTADWIPFIHSISYSGGPGLSLAVDLQELLGGNPMAQDQFLHNWKRDPVATLLGLPFKFGVPLGDVLEALAAETNMTRRQRRLFGIPRQSYDTHEIVARLMGFRPLTDMPKHEKLLISAVEPIFEPAAHRIREAFGNE
jgi:hypothetical protein